MSATRIDDATIERAILDALADRADGASVCPSEIARAVARDDAWRVLMEPVRRAAARLAARGRVEITQRGAVVELANVRGPVRIRLRAAR